MICKECGCPYDANLPSCPECGCPNDSVVSATNEKDNPTVCPYCGAPSEGFKICQWCGHPLEEGAEHEEHESILSDTYNNAEDGIEQEKQESVLPDINNTASSSSIDQNKKKRLNPWYILLPVGALLITFICVIILRNREDYKNENGVKSNVEANSSRESTQYVYSCAYDGFVNMRATASYSAPKVGEFRNGPEGAILLEEEGDWIRIDVNGLVGFVPSKYVRKTPTVAYTGDISVDWLEGMWSSNGGFITSIFNNGTYEHGYDYPTERGKYIMQNKDEIVFTPLWIDPWLLDGTDDAELFKAYTLKITNKVDKEMSKLLQDGDVMPYRQIRFMTQKELDEYGDEIWSDGMMTISTFRSHGRDVLKQIEEIEK